MIEAMSRGLCAVGSRVGGIVELADDDALFPADNAEALAALLLRLYESPEVASSLARDGHERVRRIIANADPVRVTRFLSDIAGHVDASVTQG
jgi:glycosyltransferase involved in cell wall biosynthesis